MPAKNDTMDSLVVWKYGTGHPIPPGAQYLHTEVESVGPPMTAREARLVWHYFLVNPRA